MFTLTTDEYVSRVYGCWLGKSIGGTLGGPHEGRTEVLDLRFYNPVPTEPAPNDDLDLQLVWLSVLEKKGPEVSSYDLGQAWLKHITYPFDEYGIARRNLQWGLAPPVTGWFDNWFTDCMGAPIRSEIWACIAPGLPDVAAEYACRDAVVDHAGEGVHGEVFLAAVESAAFVCSDRQELLDLGLAYVPADCRVARAVRLVREAHAAGDDWQQARARVLAEHGHHNFTDAPQNLAFIALGWLYGRDFGDALLTAVNCGYDTDCTGATLGAILGILLGRDGLPQEWREPIGEEIRTGWGVGKFDAPADLQSLTERTLAVGRSVLEGHSARVRLVEEAAGGKAAPSPLSLLRPAEAPALALPEPTVALYPAGPVEVAVNYHGDPSVRPGETKSLTLSLRNRRSRSVRGHVLLGAPEGWEVSPSQARAFLLPRLGDTSQFRYEVTAPEGSGRLELPHKLSFTIVPFGGTQKVLTIPLIACNLWQVRPACGAGAEETLWARGHELDVNAWLREPGQACDLRALFFSARRRQCRFIVSCDARTRVWLNGELVLENETPRPIVPAGHRSGPGTVAQVTLHAGRNEVLLHILREEQPVALHVFFTDSKKQPLGDLPTIVT